MHHMTLYTPDFPSYAFDLATKTYTTLTKGVPNSKNYSIYFINAAGNAVSPFHDIPLYANEEKTLFNMVVEIPRWTNALMEISMTTPLNPIKQAVKNDKLQFVPNCFPHKGYIWNYGAIPQTWQDPAHIEPRTGLPGDSEPIDVIEIGYRVAKCGAVIQVKLLGAIAIIDKNKTDWKMIAIDIKDPFASQVNNMTEVEQHFPGLYRATLELFQLYKMPNEKYQTQFGNYGIPIEAPAACSIISYAHESWQNLLSKPKPLNSDYISCVNVTNAADDTILNDEANDIVLEEIEHGDEVENIPNTIDKWHFLSL